MQIKIKALDTLFFRDGKPFSMGEESWADGIFPPPPSVFYGALRTLYFSQNSHEIHLANTPEDPTKDFKIKGIYFYFNEALHFINPKDYVKVKVDEDGEEYNYYDILSIEKKSEISTYTLEHFFLQPEKGNIKDDEGFIINDSFRKYVISGSIDENIDSIIELSKYIQIEPKIGIGRNKQTNTTNEGLLYRVGTRRLAFTSQLSEDKFDNSEEVEYVSLIVDFEGLEIKGEQGTFKLGGEGKFVSYQILNDEVKVPGYKLKEDAIFFKLYLLTPALFKSGWKPDWIEDDNIGFFKFYNEETQSEDEIQLKLLTASIGKPVAIGGFDMQKKEPKPLLKAVPAGSVYYFEVLNKSDIAKVSKAFQLKSISEINQKEGFGITIVAKPNVR